MKQLRDLLCVEIETFEKAAKEELRAQMRQMAAESGFHLEDIMEEELKRRNRKPVSPPKYFNPDDPQQTWTGKGRKPGWIAELLESGKTLEELEIQK